jgi:hypothetical protein
VRGAGSGELGVWRGRHGIPISDCGFRIADWPRKARKPAGIALMSR